MWDKFPKDRAVLLQGGTRSGKTYSVIEFLINFCLKYSGVEIDIVRDTFTALNATAWRDFKKQLYAFGLYDEKKHNKTEHQYVLNNNLISYYGADNPEKIHGRSRDVLWINEPQYFPPETADQLLPRTRYRVIMDYNPALPGEHWIQDYIDKYGYCHSTYKDNPYLTPGQIAEIESRVKNPYWWKVYGLGERAVPEGVIFTNWKRGSFDTSLPYAYGMDFGFTNDPTVHVKVAIDKDKIYVKKTFSGIGMSTGQIADALEPYKKDLTIADSSEPRLIDELKRKGINIEGAAKGPDSVRSGINAMLDYEIIVDDSPDIEKELNLYRWNDKRSGIPVDADNHYADSVRYAFDRLRYKPRQSMITAHSFKKRGPS